MKIMATIWQSSLPPKQLKIGKHDKNAICLRNYVTFKNTGQDKADT